MNKSFLILILFVSLFTYAEADYEKSDPKTQKFFDQYEECIYKNLNKEHYLSIHYELQRYLPNYGKQNKKSKLYCNKIIDIFFVNKSNNNKLKKQFDKSVEDGLFKNDSKNKNLYIDIYLTYHLNILWNSENNKDVKNSLIEIEENYLKKSDFNDNPTASSILSNLGWFYNVKLNFTNFNKAHEYLLKSTKIQKSKNVPTARGLPSRLYGLIRSSRYLSAWIETAMAAAKETAIASMARRNGCLA